MRKVLNLAVLLLVPACLPAAVLGTAYGRMGLAPLCGASSEGHVCVLTLSNAVGDETTVYCLPPVDAFCAQITAGSYVQVDVIGYPAFCQIQGELYSRLYANAQPRWWHP